MLRKERPNQPLELFPLVAVDAGLAQNLGQEASADFAPVQVGDIQLELVFEHELVAPTRVRAIEPKLPQVANEIIALDRTKRGH